jgi:hypothetical protein
MGGVLTATAAEFLEFQPFGRRFAVLRCRIVPLFAITALQRDNFSGHKNSSWLLPLRLLAPNLKSPNSCHFEPLSRLQFNTSSPSTLDILGFGLKLLPEPSATLIARATDEPPTSFPSTE